MRTWRSRSCRQALQGLSYSVDYRPVLFAGLLKHHGQLGPAEIAPKRDWTYRQVLWLAHTTACPCRCRPRIRSIRCRCCGWRWPAAIDSGLANRYVCETIFRHVWRGGADAGDAQRLEALTAVAAARARPGRRGGEGRTQGQHRRRDRARRVRRADVRRGRQAVLGLRALPMLRAYLEGDAWFAGGDWEAAQVGRASSGPSRVRSPEQASGAAARGGRAPTGHGGQPPLRLASVCVGPV